MKRLLCIFILSLILLPLVFAECESGQVDINSASLNDLDKLYGIGGVKAQAIIDSRSYDSIEDLIKAKGIGEKTLDKIKSQNLACINEKNSGEENSKPNSTLDEIKTVESNPKLESSEKSTSPEPILLNYRNAKNIKTENNVEKGKNNYAFYGFILFCVLITLLFILRRKKFQNEFG